MIEKTTKEIKIPMVKMEIEISEIFYKHLTTAKSIVEKEIGQEMTIGDYIERTWQDFLDANAYLEAQIMIMKGNGFIPKKENTEHIYG